MELIASQYDKDWERASTMLLDVVAWLDSMKTSLWSKEQVSIESLREHYLLDQLFWLRYDSQLVGVVFLMDSDPFFWPEQDTKSSLYFHKLAIHPNYSNKGLGKMALDKIREHAISIGCEFVRLDCDDREPLHRFYSNNGYQLIDIKLMQSYSVARYELPIISPKRQSRTEAKVPS